MLALIKRSNTPLSISDILTRYTGNVAERTLRRWLSKWVAEGSLIRTGNKRSTRYTYCRPTQAASRFMVTCIDGH